MASEPFNSVGGYTVGIPPTPVVNNSGVVVGDVNTDYVLANTVLTDNLRYANGARYVPGSNTQLVFNNSNSFGASANLTFNSTTNFLTTTNLSVTGTASLGNVANVSILGGLNGYFLQTDGLGQLTWAAGGNGGGGNGNPGGSNTQVQFNNAGSFGGDAGFTYDQNTNTLVVPNINSPNFTGNLTGVASTALTANTVINSSQPNIVSVGTLVNLSVTGAVTGQSFAGDGGNLSNISAANLVGSVPLAAHVSANAQPNITSVGNLLVLEVAGTATAGNLNSSNRISGGNLFITGNVSVGGNISFSSANSFLANANTIEFNSANINFGDASYIHILGGFNGQLLGTDGQGNLSWVNGGGGGGGGSPVGPNTAIQYNNGGIFGGTSRFTWNNSSSTMSVAGNLIANSLSIGSGIYQFATTSVYTATTSSTSANQTIWSVPSSQVSAVEFTIVSTNITANTRTTVKIASTILGSAVDFNKYAGLEINGGVGNFNVAFNAGNLTIPPSLVLRVTPLSASSCNYNMVITQYAEI
jgi:hypothetical protein